jgi:hypothetical protein
MRVVRVGRCNRGATQVEGGVVGGERRSSQEVEDVPWDARLDRRLGFEGIA